MSTPSQHRANGKAALLRRRSSSYFLFTVVIIAATIWNNSVADGAPAKLDALVTPFTVDLQPPIFEAATVGGDDDRKALDSYGNPIESLKPIETPDGRKVVSAQGLQFEIPNYASGITELKKPSDDLLPPSVDPIAVAVPNDSSESFATSAGPAAASFSSTTDVDVENVQLAEVHTDASGRPFKGLPEYIVELNDPDIGGPVEYMPTDANRGLSVISWDLLPPLDADPAAINESSKQKVNVGLTTSQSTYSHSNAVTGGRYSSEDQQEHLQTSQATQNPFEFNTESATKYGKTQQTNRGRVHYTTSTTPRLTTTKSTTTTTTTTTRRPTTTTTPHTTSTSTTRRTSTTPRTTTTTTTTTRTTKTPRTTTTTTPQPDTSEFFKLAAGDSYTLPSWLADIDDPDLDVAVAYIVPDDINEYNHTISTEILPPLEPYTDLNVVNLTPPPSKDKPTTTTTPRTTTTRRSTTTRTTSTTPRSTTTRSFSNSQPHWVRAKATPSTTARPTSSSFSNQFTSFSSPTFNSPTFTTSAGNYNFAQRTTTTTTTTVKPKTTINPFNRPLSNTDKISSEEITPTDIQKQQNGFLSAYKPQPFSKASTTTTRRTTTTTTTTTPSPKYVNPFEPTIPPWLKGFDYPDVGPGVPFVYDPNDGESPVDEDILPPSKTNADVDTTKATFPNSATTATSFLNSHNPQSFSNKFSSTATSLTTSSSIPSKVTLPLPSIELNKDDNSVAQPHSVFATSPPTPAEDFHDSKKTSSSFNTHFPARFEPTSATDNTNKVPLSADRESFPPFNTPNTGSAVTTKTTFSKSEDGKVITKNVFLNGAASQTTSTKSFGTTAPTNTQQKDTFGVPDTGFTKASTNFNQFTTSAGASGFVTASSSASTSGGLKYTGNFGGPPGLLAPNANSKPAGFATASTPVTQSYNKPSTNRPYTATTAVSNSKFTGSFGGPPGVLRPYDNVKSV